jgi:acyl-CoA synthetase (AMP-forming)/AMP-acid ligase II
MGFKGELKGSARRALANLSSGHARADLARVPAALLRSGVWRSARPTHLLPVERAVRRWGSSVATLAAVAAIRFGDDIAVFDDRGALTYRELDRRCAAQAAGLHADLGLGPGSSVAVLCRNHRGFLEATLAASRLGADVLFLNTEFAAPQLAAVLENHAPDLVVLDDEFTTVLDATGCDVPSVLAWHETAAAHLDLDRLAEATAPAPPTPATPGRLVILTSGTTGTPKAASRAPSALALGGLTVTALSRFGLRSGEPMLLCPPLFHGLGLLHSMLALFLGCPLVLSRRFDPADALRLVEERRAGAMLAVPVMLRRMLDDAPGPADTSSLRVVISGASSLDPALATRFMDRFGDVLCDTYGSSEIGIASIATAADLRAAPGTVGRPCLGSTVRILDRDDRPVGPDTVGRVFAGGGLVFGGYAGGGTKEVVDGLMSTGDLGHLDAAGRLYIDGREDDMIVSGGENVYPQEVEEALGSHPAVAEVAVVGVDDPEFGQRLVAYIVLSEHAEADAEALQDHVRQNLARYKVPREIHLVGALPRNATGKVLRNQLG